MTPAFDISRGAGHKVRAEATLPRRPTLTLRARSAPLADTVVPQILRTFKVRLLPRKGQHKRLRAALDMTRNLYNAALEERISIYSKTGKSANLFSQYKGLTELRADSAYTDFPVTLQRWPLKKLDLAFAAFFARMKRGEKPGFPRFRGRDWFKSFGFSDIGGWRLDGNRLYMKGIGRVKVHLHRPIPSKPLSCQIKRAAKGWVALFVCAVEAQPLPATGRSIGIDLGISSFVATSDGETIPGFHAARRAQAELRRRQRALSRCKRGSRNRRKTKARVTAHTEKIARSRRTFLHQVAARLVRENDVIVIENLNIKGLGRSMLARDIHDAGWGAFIQLLTEKAAKAARSVMRVDPRFTSQTCPECSQIKAKTLAERIHKCDCGCVLDRDVAAAKVILSRAGNRPGTANVAGCSERSSRNICEAP